jgi:PAS domain S-box-containing protein
MNIYALLSLCASAISASLGLSVYFLNRKSVINRLFMLMMLANAYWAFCEFMMRQASSFETAALWSKAIGFWPFVVALIVNFALAFTESDLLKNKLVYVALYFPALLFSLINLMTNWISGILVLKYWGYDTTAPYSGLVMVDGVWAAVMSLWAIFLFVGYYNRVVDEIKKQQTKFVAVGFAISICLSLVTDSVFPVAGVNFPSLASISGSAMSLFIVYGMLRYELFGFRPEIAAENIFSSMADSIILVNLEGVIIKVNRSLLELYGCGEEDFVGKSIDEIVEKTGANTENMDAPLIMAEVRRQREMKNQEITLRSKLGEDRTCILSCSMVCDSRGQDVGAAFVLHDVTERRAMEQKLIKAERLASVGELAGILGHDLRNPLDAIGVATYYLRTKYANMLDSKDEAMFENINQSIDYSNKIINDLIDYSSEIKLGLEAATPKSLVTGALAQVSPPLNIHVTDETADALEFQVDEGKMRRAFVNIVKNAFDAMPDGGELTIKSEKADGMVVFSFRDTGDGMTQETLSKLWTPLFTTKAKGMGFGLAICRRIVEAHGGKISAESQLKAGTTIRVELPLNRSKS